MKYSFVTLSGEKICFDGFWEGESQYLGGGGDERGRIEGIVSGGGEDINPTSPLHDSTSLILQYKQISVHMRAVGRNWGKIVFCGIVVEALLSTC